MNTPVKLLIVAALAVAVVAAVALRKNKASVQTETVSPSLQAQFGAGSNAASAAAAAGSATGGTTAPVAPVAAGKLPKLVDLGADKCVPCKMMAPMLEELKREYAGGLEVEFIDVWKNPAAGRAYGIQMIPTQIFYDAEGKERFRHVGFIGKDDILAKWKELGVDLKKQ